MRPIRGMAGGASSGFLRQRSQVAELRAENQRLKDRKAQLSAPGALESEARRLGMVKAGERAYIVK